MLGNADGIVLVVEICEKQSIARPLQLQGAEGTGDGSEARNHLLPSATWPPRAARVPCSEKFFNILAKQIGFEIDGISDLPFVERRHFVGMRNDPDAKITPDNCRDSEADA